MIHVSLESINEQYTWRGELCLWFANNYTWGVYKGANQIQVGLEMLQPAKHNIAFDLVDIWMGGWAQQVQSVQVDEKNIVCLGINAHWGHAATNVYLFTIMLLLMSILLGMCLQ